MAFLLAWDPGADPNYKWTKFLWSNTILDKYLFESWNCDFNSDENRVLKWFRPDGNSQKGRPRSKISSLYESVWLN